MSNFDNLFDQIILCCDIHGHNCTWCSRAKEGHPTERCMEELLSAVFSELVETREKLRNYENLD